MSATVAGGTYARSARSHTGRHDCYRVKPLVSMLRPPAQRREPDRVIAFIADRHED